MKFELNMSKNQIKKLTQMVYLGSIIMEEVNEEYDSTYDEVAFGVYEEAYRAGLKNSIEYHKEDDLCFPNDDLRSEMEERLLLYKQFFFVKELAFVLSMRDLFENIDKKTKDKIVSGEMSDEKIQELLDPYEKKYLTEFEKYETSRLVIDESKDGLLHIKNL